ncbi:MAG TPA: hypothetical protein VEQ59_25355 [Polyangiaceae bacterium]|nr:hypothetical protein [Polyangiaceae bacterium]
MGLEAVMEVGGGIAPALGNAELLVGGSATAAATGAGGGACGAALRQAAKPLKHPSTICIRRRIACSFADRFGHAPAVFSPPLLLPPA